MKVHLLKSHPGQFEQVWSGAKTHETRINDRDFEVGDVLFLGEWKQGIHWEYGRQVKDDAWFWTGAVITAIVKQITAGGKWGIAEGYCVMSIKVLSKTNYYEIANPPPPIDPDNGF